MRRAVLFALLGPLPGCSSCGQGPGPLPPSVSAQVDLAIPGVQPVAESFEALYPIFLYRRSMSQGDKAQLWSRYRQRWVRWEGVIASINDKGVTMKHLITTSTFDVSLTCEAAALPIIRERYAVGDRVRYTGRLDSFDDVFRTMYLTNGTILEKTGPGDLGVPLDLARP